MRTFLALTLLAMTLPQTQTRTQIKQPNPSGLEIVNLSFKKKWAELGRTSSGIVSLNPPEIAPVGRAAGGIRTSSGIWNTTVWTSKAWVYDFRAEMKNNTSQRVTIFVWAYHLPASSNFAQDAPGKEYLCNVRIEPGETKLVKVRSTIPHPRVVDSSTLDVPPPAYQPSLDDMIVNQVRFADETIWQRPGWNPVVLSRLGAKKLGKGKCIAL